MPRNPRADFRRVVSRTVVNDDHFEIRACLVRALDCARQKPGTVISRDDDAYFRHNECEVYISHKKAQKAQKLFYAESTFVCFCG